MSKSNIYSNCVMIYMAVYYWKTDQISDKDLHELANQLINDSTISKIDELLKNSPNLSLL